MPIRPFLIIMLAFLLPSLPGQERGQSRTEAGELAREIHRQGGYPDSLPRYEEPEEAPQEERSRSSSSGIDLSGLSPVLLAVFATILLVLIFVSSSGEELRERFRKGKQKQKASPKVVQEEPEEEWERRDPEALSGAGSLTAALAALLYRSLRLTGWEPVGRQASLTAREILSRLTGADPRREPIALVVALAEQAHFGGREVTATILAQAQAAFSRAEMQEEKA